VSASEQPQSGRPAAGRSRRPGARRRAAGWVALVLGFAATAGLAAAPAPFVIEQPGPVLNVLGDVTLQGQQQPQPLISIADAPEHEASGQLDMLTVTRVGDPDKLPGWLTVIMAWFDPTKVLLPVGDVFPPGYTAQDQATQDAAQMSSSQDVAVAAALGQLGIPYQTTITVQTVGTGAPAAGLLQQGDVIQSVDGSAVSSMDQVAQLVRGTPSGQDVVFGILRNGQPQTVSVTPQLALASDGKEYPYVGISGSAQYAFPVSVSYAVQNIGGPSAGMVFSIGIIDKLTDGKLLGDLPVAGTGTIDASGNVGAIGGVRQKAFGAAAAGAKAMLIPRANCAELGDGLPSQMAVYPVSTLQDALHVLSVLRDGGDASQLPSCPLSQHAAADG